MKFLLKMLYLRPKYNLGQIVDFGHITGLGTIVGRIYEYGGYYYKVDGMGTLYEREITEYLEQNGDPGCL